MLDEAEIRRLGDIVAEKRRAFEACAAKALPADEVERMRITMALERARTHLHQAEGDLRRAMTPKHKPRRQPVNDRIGGDWYS